MDVVKIQTFLSELADKGLAYRTVDAGRSVIPAGHALQGGVLVEEYPWFAGYSRGSCCPSHRNLGTHACGMSTSFYVCWSLGRIMNVCPGKKSRPNWLCSCV